MAHHGLHLQRLKHTDAVWSLTRCDACDDLFDGGFVCGVTMSKILWASICVVECETIIWGANSM